MKLRLQWQEKGIKAGVARLEAEDEQAIEELLRECKEKAKTYEPGGATTVKKSPGLAPGRASRAEAEEGRDCSGTSQFEDSDARETGVGRLPTQMRNRAEDRPDSPQQMEGEQKRSSQYEERVFGRQHLKRCRPDLEEFENLSTSGPRLALTPCRGVQPGPSVTPFWGSGVSEHKVDDFDRLRLLLKNKCQNDSAVVGDVGEILAKLMEAFELHVNTRCGQSSEGIFPLPLPSDLGFCGHHIPFLEAMVRGLNLLAGSRSRSKGKARKVSRELVHHLEKVLAECTLLGQKWDHLPFQQFFRARTLDYSGEEVKVARRFTWQMVEAALPQGVGSLRLTDFCDQGTLEYVVSFEKCLLPPQDQFIGKAPAIMVDHSDWAEVCRGLVARGVCGLMKREQLRHVCGRPLMNGLFAVEKGEKGTGPDGVEFDVCRLIMNLVPTNSLCRNLVGDTCTLPTVVGLSSIILEDDQLLLTSSEDIRCFFYLFQTPQSWWRYMGFAREVPSEALPAGHDGDGWHLVTKVLPMGFVNSVAIAQHIHRRVISQALHVDRSLATRHQEIRRDRTSSRADHLFRVYLDNFDELRKVDRKVAGLIEGTPSDWTLAIRETYTTLGLPRHPKKAVEQASGAEVQGAWVDGSKGTAAPKYSKVARYLGLACEAVISGKATMRELQVIGGGFVYIAMFRRPLLSGLNAIWRKITSLKELGSHVRQPLGKEVELELIRFISLSPLAFMNFRLPVSEHVTASDASTTGGGLCVSRGVSPYGLAASQAEARGDVLSPDEMDQVLVVSLFGGIGALRVALDCLRVPVAGYISVEIDDAACRVVESFFPDVIRVQDVALVDLEMVAEWSLRFASVSMVILGAGPPCQGVSGLNADRKGAMRDARSCLFQEIPRIEALIKQVFRWCPTYRLIENVASMDKHDCEAMNGAYHMEPWLVDAGGISLARRPRLYWCDWDILPQDATLWRGMPGGSQCEDTYFSAQRSFPMTSLKQGGNG